MTCTPVKPYEYLMSRLPGSPWGGGRSGAGKRLYAQRQELRRKNSYLNGCLPTRKNRTRKENLERVRSHAQATTGTSPVGSKEQERLCAGAPTVIALQTYKEQGRHKSA